MKDDVDEYLATLSDEERERIAKAERELEVEHDVYVRPPPPKQEVPVMMLSMERYAQMMQVLEAMAGWDLTNAEELLDSCPWCEREGGHTLKCPTRVAKALLKTLPQPAAPAR